MFTPTSLVSGKEIPNAAEDVRSAKRIEQYRVSRSALYIPCGLRWNYIPLSEIRTAEASHRVVSAGHCVTVDLHRPTVEVTTLDGGRTVLNLEKDTGMQALIEALGQ